MPLASLAQVLRERRVEQVKRCSGKANANESNKQYKRIKEE